ncbi:MAG: hypothetical protein FWF66_04585 [Candidatus Bathyarchaeota archaeon]|jgi:predicted phage tail protein|nr:hypothetical protein [Candidatus Termiticorpusculum sp.]MCL1970715.1 hypothetical protein [Candidatus Termiticorpusculum sp.]
MSESNIWITLAEKIVGIVLIIISGLMLYYTATTSALGKFDVIFIVLGVAVLIVGIILLLIKPQE